jgi:3',5'-cyclic AMP phosphodiesterase CpdA
MLWEIVELARSNEYDAIVFAGDLFHLKQANRTSHSTVQRMIEVVQASPCDVYFVIGNHDIQHDRVESIYETQPFGVVLKAGAHLLDGHASGLPLYGVSWQQHWDRDCSGEFERWREMDTDYAMHSLLVTHSPIYPPGQELPWENIPASTIAKWMGNVGHCYYGHVHDLHGTFYVDGVTFCNQGALSRGSLHESDLTRRPAVTVWRSDVMGPAAFERIELKTAKPVDEVFRLAAAAERAGYAGRLEAFLAAVGSSSVEIASIESVLANVRSMDLPDAVIGLAEEVLTLASHGELK